MSWTQMINMESTKLDHLVACNLLKLKWKYGFLYELCGMLQIYDLQRFATLV